MEGFPPIFTPSREMADKGDLQSSVPSSLDRPPKLGEEYTVFTATLVERLG